MRRPRVFFSAMLIAYALGLTPAAKADPIMTVTSTNYLDAVNSRLVFQYDIANISAVADANNMLTFSISAPANRSLSLRDAPIYLPVDPSPFSSYTFGSNRNTMEFTVSDPANILFPQSDTVTIFLFAPTNAVISHTGYATATARGTPGDPSIPFNQVNNLDVPIMAIPEPGAFGFGVLAMGLAVLCRHHFRASHSA